MRFEEPSGAWVETQFGFLGQGARRLGLRGHARSLTEHDRRPRVDLIRRRRASMASIHDLPTPALLLDLDVLERNLRRMSERAAALGVAMRPHIKTHKSLEVAGLQKALGISGITVSTLYEARVFADARVRGRDLGLPGDPDPARRGARSWRTGSRCGWWWTRPRRSTPWRLWAVPCHVWLKVDCGYHRGGGRSRVPRGPGAGPAAGGVAHADLRRPADPLRACLPRGSREEIAAIAEQERSVMAGFAERLRGEGIEVPEVSVGSTPAMSAVARPGGGRRRRGRATTASTTSCR